MSPGEVLFEGLFVEEEILADSTLEFLWHLGEVLFLYMRAQAKMESI